MVILGLKGLMVNGCGFIIDKKNKTATAVLDYSLA